MMRAMVLATGARGIVRQRRAAHWPAPRQLLDGVRTERSGRAVERLEEPDAAAGAARAGDEEVSAAARRRARPRAARHLLDLTGVVERHPVIAGDPHGRRGDDREDRDEHDDDHQLDEREAGLEAAPSERGGDGRTSSFAQPTRIRHDGCGSSELAPTDR